MDALHGKSGGRFVNSSAREQKKQVKFELDTFLNCMILPSILSRHTAICNVTNIHLNLTFTFLTFIIHLIRLFFHVHSFALYLFVFNCSINRHVLGSFYKVTSTQSISSCIQETSGKITQYSHCMRAACVHERTKEKRQA